MCKSDIFFAFASIISRICWRVSGFMLSLLMSPQFPPDDARPSFWRISFSRFGGTPLSPSALMKAFLMAMTSAWSMVLLFRNFR